MVDQTAIEHITARVGDLPAMPAVVSEVLRITEDAATTMAEVSRSIETDPALTAKILRVSNSAYYGMRQYVGTLKLALVILGVREVRNIVLGISVFDTLKDQQGDVRVGQEVWDASLRVASIAKKLGTEMGLGLQGEEFITGLLTDIGKIVLLRHDPRSYSPIYDQFKNEPEELCKKEIDAFGCAHADVATALTVKWNLPPAISDALWHQYPDPRRPLTEAEDAKLAAVVRLAKWAAHDDFSEAGQPRCLQDTEAWELLSTVKHPILEKDRHAVLEAFLEVLKEAPRIEL